MSNSTDNKTRAVSVFDFHGMTLLVVENAGKRYVEAKPLGALVGLDWRRLRDTVQKEDNAVLYGTRRLVAPVLNSLPSKNDQLKDSGIALEGGPGLPLDPALRGSEEGLETENTSENGVLHVLFERVQMFLARVNTTQMRVQGNVTGANYLLALQIEWAQVLHKYESGHEVSKKGRREDAGLIANLMKTRALAKPWELASFDAMVRDAMAEMGYPAAIDPQKTLPLES